MKRSLMRSAAPFESLALARVVEQHAAHKGRRHGKKMRSIVPFHFALSEQFQIGFVYQGSSLQSMARAFAAHARRSQAPQILIDQRDQFVGGLSVAAT